VRAELPVNAAVPSYRQHRYPAAIIARGVRQCDRSALREQGVSDSGETMRRWCRTCGPRIVGALRRQ